MKPVTATEGLNFCNQLFAVERKLKELSSEERYNERLKQSKPVLDAFLSWLKIQEQIVLPKSALGKAVNYCLNQWDKLVVFLGVGRLEIDNNRIERSGQARCDRTKGLALREYTARCTGQRHYLQHCGDSKSKWIKSILLSSLSI